MKNKLKFLMFALILPCALLVSACGNGGNQLATEAKANIGSEATVYTEEGAETALTEVLDAEVPTVTGWRLTADMDMEFMTMHLNGVFKADEAGKTTFAATVDMSMDMSGMLPETATDAEKAEAKMEIAYEMYLTADALYINLTKLPEAAKAEMPENMPTKMKVALENSEDMMGMFGGEEALNSLIGADPSQILAQLSNALDNTDVTITVNKEGALTRFKLSYGADGEVAYYVFNNGTFDSFQQTFDGVSVTAQVFNGNINYPNFAGYQDFDPSTIK